MFYKKITIIAVVLTILNCAQREVKVGIAVPLSGEQSIMAKGILQGAQLAVDEWNMRGGVLGSKIILEIADDEARAEKAIEIARYLINKKVIGVIGHMNSDCSIAASKIYNAAGVVMISPSSTNPKLTQQHFKNIFRICGRDDIQAKTAADFIIDVLKIKSIYFIHDRSVYGEGITKSVKEFVNKRIKIKGESAINRGDTLFTGIVEEVKKLNPHIIYFGGYDPEGARIVTQLRKGGINALFMGGDGLGSEGFLKLAGKNGEGVYFTFGLAVEDLGSAMHFVRLYKENYKNIDSYAPYAYDATNILLEAYCRTKDSIVKALHQYQFDGALGLIAFDEKGDVLKAPYMVWVVKDGIFVPWTKQL